MDTQMTPQQMELMARKSGFQSAAQMAAWQAQRNRLNSSPVADQQKLFTMGQTPIGQQQARPDARPGWGPSAILNYVASRLSSVMP